MERTKELPALDESIVKSIEELSQHMKVQLVPIVAVRYMVANNILCGLEERERQLTAVLEENQRLRAASPPEAAGRGDGLPPIPKRTEYDEEEPWFELTYRRDQLQAALRDNQQVRDALEELVDLMESVRLEGYKPDSFTTQVARFALDRTAAPPSGEPIDHASKKAEKLLADIRRPHNGFTAPIQGCELNETQQWEAVMLGDEHISEDSSGEQSQPAGNQEEASDLARTDAVNEGEK